MSPMLQPRVTIAGAAGAVLAVAVLSVAAPDAVAEPPKVKVLAFGDSLTHGYGLPAGETFPEQLEAALVRAGHAVRVINGGNSGDTTAAGRARLDWSLAEQPDLVIVELGANDGLRGLDPRQTYANLDAILSRLAARRLPVLLAGMLAPRNLGAAYSAEYDAVFPRLAAAHDVTFYPFFLDGVAMDPRLNQADGIHPNRAGVAAIVERILPLLTPMLDRLASKPAPADG